LRAIIPIRDRNPTRTIPFITISLISINIAVFLHELTLKQSELNQFIATYGLTPAYLQSFLSTASQSLSLTTTFFTSLFLHGGFVHLIGNMLYLWIFGNNVEDALGHLRFLLFFFLCGIGASLTHVLFNPTSNIPTIGASGAISGILAAYLILFPRARIVTLVPLIFFVTFIELPAFLVILFWFFLQLVNGVAALTSLPFQTGGVAWFAHIGGFLFGFLFLPLLVKRKRI
jgi:membrane associated rhomboid family serine protease